MPCFALRVLVRFLVCFLAHRNLRPSEPVTSDSLTPDEAMCLLNFAGRSPGWLGPPRSLVRLAAATHARTCVPCPVLDPSSLPSFFPVCRPVPALQDGPLHVRRSVSKPLDH